MKWYLSLFFTLFSFIGLTSCSDDEGGSGGGKGDTYGNLIIDDEAYFQEANNFSGFDSPAIDDVHEEINTITFKTVAMEKEGSHMFNINFECERINFEKIQPGEEIEVIEGAVYPADLISLDEWTLGYKGTMLEGSVTFEGLYDDETLVRLSFHDVKVRVRSEESGREYTHTLSGSASFRRNDIGAKPDYPYADLSVNGASKEVEMDGLWIVDFDRSDPDFIQTEFEFKDGGYERRFYIQIDKYVNKDPQELVGVNLGDCSYAVVTDVRTNSEVSMKDCCKGGSISIIEIEKPPYMYMYPDITFEFDNLAVQIAGQVYYINGTAKAVYTFKLDKS